MIINDYKPTIESSGNFKESSFSVADTGMVFDILRNKLYSNPIAAICREISCNARDTHRAVGKQDIPISIYLPNTLEPFYKIKDCGEGISPDRMDNIFIKYTASTKRNDNTQTGGFGLGNKTPFSYTDMFSVITIFDGVKYSYAAMIDETKVGKMALMSEEKTDECNGTEIVIPVKEKDFRSFASSTELATRHWDVKPNIKGGSIDYVALTPIMEGTNWKILKSGDSWTRNTRLVIDSIEYPCNIEEVCKSNDKIRPIIDCFYGDLYLYFQNGDLTLSANRETIYLDDHSKNKIVDSILLFSEQLKNNIIDNLSSYDNLWDTNVHYTDKVRNQFRSLDFLQGITWQGLPINCSYLTVNCMVNTFTKGVYSRKKGNDPNKISRVNSREIHFKTKTALVINDLGISDVGARHIKSLFSDDVQIIQVINPGQTNNLKKDDDETDLVEEKIKQYHLDKMNVRYLSKITDAKVRKYNPSKVRLSVFEYSLTENKFTQTTFKNANDEKGVKVLCKIIRNGTSVREVKLKSGSSFRDTLLTKIKGSKDVKFFGVDHTTENEKIEELFSDFISIDDYIQDNFLNNPPCNFVAAKYIINRFHRNYHYDMISTYNDSNFDSLPDTSFFKQQTDKIKELSKLKYFTDAVEVYERVVNYIQDDDIKTFLKDNPSYSVDAILTSIDKKYPMITLIDRYKLQNERETLVNYIKLVDSQKENKNVS